MTCGSSCDSKLILYRDNDQLVTVTGVADALGPIPDAVITGTLYDQNGQPVDGFNDLNFAPDATTPGNYTAAIAASAFSPVTGSSYNLKLIGTSGSNSFTVYVATEVQKRIVCATTAAPLSSLTRSRYPPQS